MKKFLILIISLVMIMKFSNNVDASENRVETLKKIYSLTAHVEGGYFSEVYTAPFNQNDRATAGSIYFLLAGKDVSHFHKIDCDEIWYYHEGCGLKVFVLQNGKLEEFLLGKNTDEGQRAMVIIPAGAVFAAENLDKGGYTFVSCMTTPKFSYDGFKLVTTHEFLKLYPQATEKILRLTYSEVSVQ